MSQALNKKILLEFGNVILKVDMSKAKAYDLVNWKFLLHVSWKVLGFPIRFAGL